MEGLNLTRKVGQKIVIDGDIVITVKEIRGRRMTLNIQAPREKKIVREEIPKAA